MGLGCVVMSHVATQAQTWVKHKYPSEGFEISFYGAVMVTTLPAIEGRVFAKSYVQTSGKYIYTVIASSTKEKDANFERGVNAGVDATGCKIESSTDLKFLIGWKAREYRGKDCKGGVSLEMRFFAIGKWFYVVQATYPQEPDREKSARRFVESFKHIDWE